MYLDRGVSAAHRLTCEADQCALDRGVPYQLARSPRKNIKCPKMCACAASENERIDVVNTGMTTVFMPKAIKVTNP